jgi:6 kDa early secretory antigenic target
MSDDQRIVVNYATLHAASEHVGKAMETMNGLLQQLEGDAKPLVHEWTGDAQTAYLERQQQWRNSAEHLSGMLREIRIAIDASAEGYKTADGTAAKGFQR